MCGHLRQARGWKRRKMRGGSHSLLPLLNITCNEKEINCLWAGRCAIMIPMTWVMRTPIPCMLLNDRDPCRCSKHVIHDQAAVEVILHALVWIARCLQPQMRLYFGRLQQLPSLQGLTGGQDIPRFLLSLIPGLFFLPPSFLSSLSSSKASRVPNHVLSHPPPYSYLFSWSSNNLCS